MIEPELEGMHFDIHEEVGTLYRAYHQRLVLSSRRLSECRGIEDIEDLIRMDFRGSVPSEPPFSAICRLEIDEHWTANEFTALFGSMNAAYKLLIERCVRLHAYYLWHDGIGCDDKDRYFRSMDFYRSMGIYELRVRKIWFASPGVVDLAGLGSALGHFKDLIISYFPTREQKLKNRERSLAILEKTISILKSIGFTDNELRDLILHAKDPFEGLINIGKIREVAIAQQASSDTVKGSYRDRDGHR